MRIEQIHELLEIVRCGSINKAGNELGLSHQRLSNSMRSLENEFGVQIFARNSKGMALTQEGHTIVNELGPFADTVESLKAKFRKKSNEKVIHGSLRVYREMEVFMEYWLSFMPDMTKRFPGVKIISIDTHYEYICDALQKDEAAIGLAILFDGYDKQLPEELEFIPVTMRLPVVYAAKHNTFCRTHKSTSLAALLQKPLIDYNLFPSQNSVLQHIFRGVGEPDVRYSASNHQLFMNILLNEDCLYVASRPQKLIFNVDQIATIPIRNKINIYFGFLVNKKYIDDPVVNLFMDQYRQFYKIVL